MRSRTSLPGWARVGDPLVLAEASFLAEELEAQGIDCLISSTDKDAPPDQPLHQILVKTEALDGASRIRNSTFPPEAVSPTDTEGIIDSRWARAGLAGTLGLVFGARLGARLRDPRWALFVPPALALACFATAFFWPDPGPN